MEYQQFLKIFTEGSKKTCAYEKQVYQSKSERFHDKNLRKTIMRRSRLLNIFFQEKTEKSKKAYNRQKKLLLKSPQESKKKVFC